MSKWSEFVQREDVKQVLRKGFKQFNHWMLIGWRLGLGPYMSFAPRIMGRYVVLTHTGRKTGLQRRTPVNFAEIDGDIYITAGFGEESHWYRNIMAKPQIELWLPDGWWQAEAADVTDDPRRVTLMREVLQGSGFASFAAGINPYAQSDAELAAATTTYRLLRLHRVARRSGTGGPGDLRWVWGIVGAVGVLLLPLLFKRPKRKS